MCIREPVEYLIPIPPDIAMTDAAARADPERVSGFLDHQRRMVTTVFLRLLGRLFLLGSVLRWFLRLLVGVLFTVGHIGFLQSGATGACYVM